MFTIDNYFFICDDISDLNSALSDVSSGLSNLPNIFTRQNFTTSAVSINSISGTNANVNVSKAGYTPLIATIAGVSNFRLLITGCSLSGNTVTVQMENPGSVNISNVSSTVQVLYIKN